MPTAEPPLIPGYSYVRPLGTGGFSSVYLYAQEMPQRQVAIKVLGGAGADLAAVRRNFMAEVHALARVGAHPAVVTVYEASVTPAGAPYIAMGYCPHSLKEAARHNPLPLPQVLDVGVRIASALESAHRTGVLHCDIKPSNILVNAAGRPVLADFGIAKLRGQAGSGAHNAMSLPWAAPEVLGGAQPSVASEVWSLGATLYGLAAGVSPFAERGSGGQSAAARAEALRRRISRANYVPVPDVRGYDPFDEVLRGALVREPGGRYASMLEFAEALQRVQRGFGWEVTPLDIFAAPPAELPHTGAAGQGQAQRQVQAAAGVPLVQSIGGPSRSSLREQVVRDTEQRQRRREASGRRRAYVLAGVAVAALVVGGCVLWSVLGGG